MELYEPATEPPRPADGVQTSASTLQTPQAESKAPIPATAPAAPADADPAANTPCSDTPPPDSTAAAPPADDSLSRPASAPDVDSHTAQPKGETPEDAGGDGTHSAPFPIDALPAALASIVA